MASSKEYLQFILGQLSDLEDVAYRAMMGEHILHYKGKIIGGIYVVSYCIFALLRVCLPLSPAKASQGFRYSSG